MKSDSSYVLVSISSITRESNIHKQHVTFRDSSTNIQKAFTGNNSAMMLSFFYFKDPTNL